MTSNKYDFEHRKSANIQNVKKVEKKDVTPSEPHEENKKNKSNIKYILNIVLVLLVTAVTICITVFSDLENFSLALKNIKWEWVLISLGLVFSLTLVRAFGIFCFAKLYTRDYKLHQALAVDQIGVFYSGVTPGASGGQFVQAYTMGKQGLSVSTGASIMVMNSIVYQVVLILFGLVSFIVEREKILSINAISFTFNDYVIQIPFLPIIIFGFLINVAFVMLLFLMSFSKKFHHFIIGPFIGLLSKIRLVKNPEKSRENLRIQVENFKIELKRLASNVPFAILVSIITFTFMTLVFSVPCFAGKALGAEYEVTFSKFWESVFFSNFHQMVTGLIPIPGSAGVSEYVFAQLFSNYFGNVSIGGSSTYSITSATLLLWRTITFTVPLFIGGLVAAFYKASPKEEVRGKDLNRETFVALQRETYIERKESAETLYETRRLSRSAIITSLKSRNKEEQQKKKAAQQKQQKKIKTGIEITDWNEIEIIDDDEDY